MSTHILLVGLILCAATAASTNSAVDAKNRFEDSLLRQKLMKAIFPMPGKKEMKEESLKNLIHMREKVDEEFVNERLPEEVISLYYEGDIILTSSQKVWLENKKREEDTGKMTSDKREIQRRAVVTANNEKWTNGIVPYVLDSRLSRAARNAIEDAISEYTKTTCIRFRLRTRESDYIRFFSGSGCYSYIGRVGGVQEISIGSGCEYTGIVMHEIFHALGRWHEQSRPDRDTYIRVNYGNIRNGLEQNFAKVSSYSASTNGIKYDIQSIMHYGAYAFSRNGHPTIVPRAASGTTRVNDVGQRDRFTPLDLQHVNRLYNCDSTSTNTGSWSSWGNWRSCSVSCNGGVQSRSRSCTGGSSCNGERTQTRSCNTNSCSGYWRSWGSWGSCSCYTKTQTRSRKCSVRGGCTGSATQTRSCTNVNCDGGQWATWGAWKCGRSYRWRKRECIGDGCSGSRIDFVRCSGRCICSQSAEPAAQVPTSSSPAVTSSAVGCVLLKMQGGLTLSTLGSDVLIGKFDDEDVRQRCITLAAKKGLKSVGIIGAYCVSGSALAESKEVVLQPSKECANGTGKQTSYDSSEQYMNVHEIDSSLQATSHGDGLQEEGRALERTSGAPAPLFSSFTIALLTVLMLTSLFLL